LLVCDPRVGGLIPFASKGRIFVIFRGVREESRRRKKVKKYWGSWVGCCENLIHFT